MHSGSPTKLGLGRIPSQRSSDGVERFQARFDWKNELNVGCGGELVELCLDRLLDIRRPIEDDLILLAKAVDIERL